MERVCLFDPYRLFVLQSLSPDGFCEIDTQTNECLPVAGEEEEEAPRRSTIEGPKSLLNEIPRGDPADDDVSMFQSMLTKSLPCFFVASGGHEEADDCRARSWDLPSTATKPNAIA